MEEVRRLQTDSWVVDWLEPYIQENILEQIQLEANQEVGSTVEDKALACLQLQQV